LDLNTYQEYAYGTSVYKDHMKIGGLTYTILALCGETGELANKLKKHLRAGTQPDNAVLADELGDVLWYVSAVAKELGLKLDQIALMNLGKLQQRREEKLKVG
jgi:NTP pyrophosphatase (non-canonical NTP hydrolase)